ncbi:MAG: F0F1 ATP synthase subunit epsilon [Weeksellaceae bacterium]
MELNIISPQQVIFNGEVDSVTVPGKTGEFQMLNNHAAIVSSLVKGTVKIKVHSKSVIDFENLSGELKKSPANELVYLLEIEGGVVEMSNNKITILAS